LARFRATLETLNANISGKDNAMNKLRMALSTAIRRTFDEKISWTLVH